MTDSKTAEPMTQPFIHIPSIDWQKLRGIDRTKPLLIGGPIIHNEDIFHAVKWLWAAEEATKERLDSNSWLGKQTSKDVAEFEAGSFVTTYEHGDIWAIGEKPQINSTFTIQGSNRERYSEIGRAKSGLGHPLSEDMSLPDSRGRYQRFSNGEMYWSPTTGAYEVYGDIFALYYADAGRTASWLGYPVTGHLPIPDGWLISFEKGQITWRSSDRHIEKSSYVDKVLAKYNALGGIDSPLGLPMPPNLEVKRRGHAYHSHFQGGSITVPLSSPNPSALQTIQLELWFRGLECQVRQENPDQMFASFGCFVPSTLAVTNDRFGAEMGDPGARIAKNDSLLYSGPPATLYVSAGLHEVDNDFGFDIEVNGTGDQGWYDSAPTSMQRFGAPTGRSPEEAAQRETIVHPLRYKVWFQTKYYDDWWAIDRGGSDVYPPGFIAIHASELHQQPGIQTLTRPDDGKTLQYTHTFTVTATDDGGDVGYYAFYFEIKVHQVQNVI